MRYNYIVKIVKMMYGLEYIRYQKMGKYIIFIETFLLNQIGFLIIVIIEHIVKLILY